jgi:hypothetical protein
VTVLSKGVLLRLPVKRLATGTGRSVRVKAYVRDLDNSDEEMTVSTKTVDFFCFDTDLADFVVLSRVDQQRRMSGRR